MSDRMNSHPKWINPCGGTGQVDMISHEAPDSIPVPDKDLLSQIILTARFALSEAKNFREDYIQKTFSNEFQQYHNLWKIQRQDWLPSFDQIPKHLGEDVSGEHLETLQLDKTLQDTYEYLQTLAVGLEQLVWDQEDDEAPFYKNFKDLEYNLRALLCEIHMAILERNLTQRPDVLRDVMPEAYRNQNTVSSRNVRDWIIFRDFMNAVEYVIQVFKYLQEKL